MQAVCKSGAYCGANCWLLPDETGKTAVVIDPSVPPDVMAQACGFALPKITAILLTHGHFDHILALREWRVKTGAPVCIHRLDAPALTDPAVSCFAQFLGKDTVFAPADILLEDGDPVPTRPELCVLHTPGHTAGSVCFSGGGVLYSGDTMFANGGIGRTDLPGGSGSALRASLRRIFTLPPETVVRPGHEGTTTVGEEAARHRRTVNETR